MQSARHLLQLISSAERGSASGGATNQDMRFSIKLQFMCIWLDLPVADVLMINKYFLDTILQRTETDRETTTSNGNDQVKTYGQFKCKPYVCTFSDAADLYR